MKIFILITAEALSVMEQEIQFLLPGHPRINCSIRVYAWTVFTISRNKETPNQNKKSASDDIMRVN